MKLHEWANKKYKVTEHLLSVTYVYNKKEPREKMISKKLVNILETISKIMLISDIRGYKYRLMDIDVLQSNVRLNILNVYVVILCNKKHCFLSFINRALSFLWFKKF